MTCKLRAPAQTQQQRTLLCNTCSIGVQGFGFRHKTRPCSMLMLYAHKQARVARGRESRWRCATSSGKCASARRGKWSCRTRVRACCTRASISSLPSMSGTKGRSLPTFAPFAPKVSAPTPLVCRPSISRSWLLDAKTLTSYNQRTHGTEERLPLTIQGRYHDCDTFCPLRCKQGVYDESHFVMARILKQIHPYACTGLDINKLKLIHSEEVSAHTFKVVYHHTHTALSPLYLSLSPERLGGEAQDCTRKLRVPRRRTEHHPPHGSPCFLVQYHPLHR